MSKTSVILLLACLGPRFLPPLFADVDPEGIPLIRVDQAAVRLRSEQALLARIPGAKPADFKFQYLYYKLDPTKPVNEEILASVYLEATPLDSRSEDIGAQVTRLIHRRKQHTVEMSPMGTVLRVSSKTVEQSELVNKN